ncbi:hypothetical protein Btru_001048 [Bulinus truncatus]|nr:hypothetical protein Btru_001048 [Bulinus truncatus]
MEDSTRIPLSPAGIAPSGFEMQKMEGGVTPSNHHMEAEAPLPPPPPPLAPIGFEAQVPAPAAATITTPTSSLIRGSLNRGSQKDQAGIAGKEDSREHVSALSLEPLHNQGRYLFIYFSFAFCLGFGHPIAYVFTIFITC